MLTRFPGFFLLLAFTASISQTGIASAHAATRASCVTSSLTSAANHLPRASQLAAAYRTRYEIAPTSREHAMKLLQEAVEERKVIAKVVPTFWFRSVSICLECGFPGSNRNFPLFYYGGGGP